jgi:hypothetical protein
MLIIAAQVVPKVTPVENQIKALNKEITAMEKKLPGVEDPAQLDELKAKIAEKKDKVKALEAQIKGPKQVVAQSAMATNGTNAFRVLFFLITFFTIGVVSNFKKLWEEGIGRLAVVYLVCLFGFIIWIGLLISWIFFHGVKPPVITG